MANAPHNLVLRYVRRIAGTTGGGDVADADLLNRFLTQHDEAAFELLLWRHGTMVWHVCRDVTRDVQASEDAFQATFLALVRKAAAIRSRESLGAWLYQVAHRAALKAQRGGRETTGIDLSSAPAELPDESALHDLRPAIHEEVLRLPAKYRAPVILCYLEGLTHEEAARQLGWPKGTVAGRVARAREMLRKRLTRRGIALSAALTALTLTPASASALVPATLVQSALRAGMLVAAGQSTAGVVSAHVLSLSEGAVRVMFWNKMKQTAAVVFVMCLVGGGFGLYGGTRPSEAPNEPAAGQDSKQNDTAGGPARTSAPRENKFIEGDSKTLRNARRQSQNNLKQITLALLNDADTYGSFPTSAIFSKDGKPLLSWRVAILPFLGEDNLYGQFHLDEAWDSAHNKKLLDKMPGVFRVPGQKDKSGTYYQVFVGESTVFEQPKNALLDGAGKVASRQPGIRYPADITDGTSNTIVVIEGGSTIPWTKPEDLPYNPLGKLPALGGAFADRINVAFADAHVQTFRKDFDEAHMRAVITRNGGEVLDTDGLSYVPREIDVKKLKQENAEISREIDKATEDVIELRKMLRTMILTAGKKEVEAGDNSQRAALTRMQRFLEDELERLESEIKRLKSEIEASKDQAKPIQKK
jgi:RNA polymerase sigma factor (sigma-70 family)